MIGAFAREDEGQALVIAALAMVVLMGALVLSVDWGYRFATSRASQNQADAAAFAAGRAIATSYNGSAFSATQENAWIVACNARNANALGGPADATVSLSVSFYDLSNPAPLAQISSSSATCALAGSTAIDPSTVFVRVESSARFPSLFGMVTRQDLRALASARVRLTAGAAVRPLMLPQALDQPVGAPGLGLSGSSTAPNVAMWPIAIRYSAARFGMGALRRITLIGAGGPLPGVSYLTYAHHSLREWTVGREAHQIITESDYTGVTSANANHGHPLTGQLANAAGNSSCLVRGVPGWETIGYSTFRGAGGCDVPNWFYYGFRGSLSVGTDWSTSVWETYLTYSGGERPDAFGGARTFSCSYAYAPVPSCSRTLPIAPCATGTPCQSWTGDWVETVPSTYVGATRVARAMQSFIARYGRDLPDRSQKAVVVNVFLWDCSEAFFPGDTANRWHLNGPTDCSDPNVTPAAPDRVHLIAVVPLTIRYSDVVVGSGNDCDGNCQDLGTQDVLSGTWGNVFGDAGVCRTTPWISDCALNPVMNSAFLVPDE